CIWCMLFFSSRRRHTRSKRDWSSDVCSSDLVHQHPLEVVDPLFISSCLRPVIVNVKGNNLAVFFLGGVSRVNRHRTVFPRPVNTIGPNTDGTRKDVSAVIVSMLTDHIDPAR